jgi:N-methylhydantoinase A/oxoprolinase/acetone carboxylase beta subunit
VQALASVEIGVDIGGTFTDVVCRRPGDPPRILKIPTTSGDPSIGVLKSLDILMSTWGIRPQEVARFVHGTTIATNAVLERKGAKIGLITTQGFKDVLEIGRMIREEMYRVILAPETPVFLAEGYMRKEIAERVSATGGVVTALDEEVAIRAIDELAAEGVEAIAVCFLFSFLNPAHEIRVRELINDKYPDIMVSVSHEVDPAFREYERSVVTAFDAFVKPVVDKYLAHLESGLSGAGVRAPLQVMQSRGGLSVSQVARQRPVRLFLSGPAGGAIGGGIAGVTVGHEDLITVDIGGTSCDIAVIKDGSPILRSEGVIEGFPVRVPMIDIHTLGAGGGSIAWLDRGGGFRVGPQSAGAEPGPVCYARGGVDATVTDASVVLGYIDPDYFAGGTVKLDPDLAREAVLKRVAAPLKMSLEEAALGVHRVLNTQMAEGIRLTTIRQGLDPRKFTLVALGGGGGLHIVALAEALHITRVLIPPHPGVLSAQGLLAAPTEHELSMAFPRPLEGLSLSAVRKGLKELDRECAKLMALEGLRAKDVEIRYFVDMCHTGQSYHLEIPLNLKAADPMAKLYKDFLAAHDRIHGYSTDSPASVVNLRTTHSSRRNGAGGKLTYRPQKVDKVKGKRKIFLEPRKPITVPVYARQALAVNSSFAGPAILEQIDTTTLVPPGWRAKVLRDGTILLTA